MRHIAVLLHRYGGLLTAVFLFFTGLTGAVISWDHELDEWLNPHLTEVSSRGPGVDMVALVADVEARYPQAQVTFLELSAEPGHSLFFWVEPRIDPSTGKPFRLDFNQVFVDPVTGEELGKREWGAVWPITRETLVSFLYKLHFSLHLPEMLGTDRWGIWLLGIIALIWTLDCFVGFYLTLPARRRSRAVGALPDDEVDAPDSAVAARLRRGRTYWQRWKPAWVIRRGVSRYRLMFDLHRAFSLWTWALLLVIAFTAFSLNLYREVFFPVMSLVSDVTPSPYDKRTPAPLFQPHEPGIDFAMALSLADQEARRRGWDAPLGNVFYSRDFDIYSVEFFHPEEGHGAGGVGHPELYLDGQDGRLLGDFLPWRGSLADVFVQAQFPLHSGRILGLPGRILISVMGVVVAMLSVTGVYIWWRKRRARKLSDARLQ